MNFRVSSGVFCRQFVDARMLSAAGIRTADINAALMSPPLKKGGRGDLRWLSAKVKQQQIPPSIAARSPTPFSKGGESKAMLSEVVDMADVTNTASSNIPATATVMTAMVVTAMVVTAMANVTAQFPPLKKGGRGDLRWLFAQSKQQQIPPSIAARSPAPFSKGGDSRSRRSTEFLRLPA